MNILIIKERPMAHTHIWFKPAWFQYTPMGKHGIPTPNGEIAA